MCGEQRFRIRTDKPNKGSPPRVRGTVALRNLASTQGRITPACAGNRFQQTIQHIIERDHPRVCGEQTGPKGPFFWQPGSPPRVRGTDKQSLHIHNFHRITPACAGNSPFPPSIAEIREDHPRVCGEQADGHRLFADGCGSPPRVRGTAIRRASVIPKTRITPACAGNRARRALLIAFATDHPRVCGEQGIIVGVLCFLVGSPPRVRGTAGRNPTWWAAAGITPACAGNSVLLPPLLYHMGDHPRVCGEQNQHQQQRGRHLGSPPRVRGTVAQLAQLKESGGITPACAGNRTSALLWRVTVEDHPRVCGEQVMVRKIAGVVGGSPPRVRGTALSALHDARW